MSKGAKNRKGVCKRRHSTINEVAIEDEASSLQNTISKAQMSSKSMWFQFSSSSSKKYLKQGSFGGKSHSSQTTSVQAHRKPSIRL